MLEGKICFITGGAQGIGLGIARACADRGATLVIADRDAAALETAKAALESLTTVRTYELDVRDRERFLQIADEVEAEVGPVYALFNNAGVIDSVAPAAMRGELWDWMVDVNLNGVYNGVQAFVPRMIKRGEGGCVVNTSSLAGLVSATSGFTYHATKYAVVGMSESLRLELAHHKINVSVVVPGAVATGIVEHTRSARPDEAEKHSSKIEAILDEAHVVLNTRGISIDQAGTAVVEGAIAGQPFIFTDGQELYRTMLEARHASILACLPECSPITAVAGG